MTRASTFYIIQPNELEKMTDEQKKHLEVYGIVIDDNRVKVQSFHLPWIRGEVDEVDHDNAPNNADFINHSCEPNLLMKKCGSLIARWHIKAGEELTYDYRTEFLNVIPFQCHCGTATCTGIVGGQEWRKVELQIKYGQNFSSYILNTMAREEEN